jgi:hypothetical protein
MDAWTAYHIFPVRRELADQIGLLEQIGKVHLETEMAGVNSSKFLWNLFFEDFFVNAHA